MLVSCPDSRLPNYRSKKCYSYFPNRPRLTRVLLFQFFFQCLQTIPAGAIRGFGFPLFESNRASTLWWTDSLIVPRYFPGVLCCVPASFQIPVSVSTYSPHPHGFFIVRVMTSLVLRYFSSNASPRLWLRTCSIIQTSAILERSGSFPPPPTDPCTPETQTCLRTVSEPGGNFQSVGSNGARFSFRVSLNHW